MAIRTARVMKVLQCILLLSLGSHGSYNPKMGYPGVRPRGDLSANDYPNLQTRDGLTLFGDIMRTVTFLLFGVNTRSNFPWGDDKIAEYPYQVSLQYLGTHKCGGVVINRQFMLTAGDCLQFDDVISSSFTVRSSSSRVSSGGHIHYVGKILQHPNKKGMVNNVALVQVHPPFTFTKYVQPISLPENDAISLEATVTGWGNATDNEKTTVKIAEYLQNRKVPILSDQECDHIDVGEESFPRNFICGGYRENDICTVEQGSPLVAKRELIGIAVMAGSCSSPPKPDVYLKIVEVRKWIIDNTKLGK